MTGYVQKDDSGTSSLGEFQSWILVADQPLTRTGEAANFFGRSVETDPDVLVIQPEDEKTAIAIEQIRNLFSLLSTRSLTGRERLILIAPADSLSLPAQQSLLKLLEEPPEKVKLVLLARSAGSLPETIRSRCLVQSLPGELKTTQHSWFLELAKAEDLTARLRSIESLPKDRENLKPLLAEALREPIPGTKWGIRLRQNALVALEGLQANVTPALCLTRLVLDNP